jgi:two-component system, response regulator, stage 0 sporulation protein F
MSLTADLALIDSITMNAKSPTTACSTKAKRILIVEDEENTRYALARLLVREGFLVDSVSNGCEALNFLRRQSVNLIVTDIKMPQMDGMTFLRELNKSYPKSNVIMITAYGGVDSYLEAMNLGAFEYINKPVQIEELKMVMKKILEVDGS